MEQRRGLSVELLSRLIKEYWGDEWRVSPQTTISESTKLENGDEYILLIEKFNKETKIDERQMTFTVDYTSGIPVQNQVRYALSGFKDKDKKSGLA